MDTDKILELLECVEFPKCKNKRTNGYKEIIHFGNIHQPFKGYISCKANTNYPELYESLKSLLLLIDPDFKASTITINKNVICEPHKDELNRGDTWIIGLGDYTGGRLIIEDLPLDIKNKPFKFDGSQLLHWTEPFAGTRYSIMFYQNKNSPKI
jgi:hypothetical protein